MLRHIKGLLYSAISLYTNFFVAYIPSWVVRKFLYRLLGLKIGKRSRINQRVYMYSPWKISIGENTVINSFSILDGRGGLTIGSNASISIRSVIYTASHKSWSETFEAYKKPTYIGDGVWICVNAVVLPGAKVKDNVILSANSVLKGETLDGGIYMGIPAKLVRLRSVRHIEMKRSVTFFL